MARITFEHLLPCPLPPAALHARLIEALRDTDQAAFWPQHLNRVELDTWDPDALFRATYRIGPLPASRMAYRIAEVRTGRGFSYMPGPGHPFRGTIHVDVEHAAAGSALRWGGTYLAPPWRPERFFFAWFAPRFFDALGRGLAGLRPEE